MQDSPPRLRGLRDHLAVHLTCKAKRHTGVCAHDVSAYSYTRDHDAHLVLMRGIGYNEDSVIESLIQLCSLLDMYLDHSGRPWGGGSYRGVDIKHRHDSFGYRWWLLVGPRRYRRAMGCAGWMTTAGSPGNHQRRCSANRWSRWMQSGGLGRGCRKGRWVPCSFAARSLTVQWLGGLFLLRQLR